MISGIQPFTTIDYPEKVACIIFTAGCNLRCGYCHNPEFVDPKKLRKVNPHMIPFSSLRSFLKKRVTLLDGVVISGGEPTIHPDLFELISLIREYGYLIKLDTNGSSPEVLERLLKDGLIDYVAMDLKDDPDRYVDLASTKAFGVRLKELVLRSIDIIRSFAPEYEFRTTLIKEVHTFESIAKIVSLLNKNDPYYIQRFRPEHVLDEKFMKFTPYTKKEALDIVQTVVMPYNEKVLLRY